MTILQESNLKKTQINFMNIYEYSNYDLYFLTEAFGPRHSSGG
jgi:hypothetical protein